MRMSVNGVFFLMFLSVMMFSILESPKSRTPASSQVLAISVDPRHALVTPVTLIPFFSSWVTKEWAL